MSPKLFLEVHFSDTHLKGLFYEVEWTVQSNTEYPNGLQKLIGCRITTAPTIIDINPDYEPMILKGDVEACFEYYKKLSDKPIYSANYVFASPNINSARFSGLLLKATDFDAQNRTIRSGVYVTSRVELSERDLYSNGEFTLYNRRELPTIYEKVLITEPVELLAKELIRAATWSKVKNLTTHNAHKEFKQLLEVVADGDFYKRLSSQLDMSEDELKKYEVLFKERFAALISSDNEFARLIERYVTEEDSVQVLLLRKLREQLIEEHPNLQEDISRLEKQKISLQEEVDKIQERVLSDELKVEQLKSEAETYSELIKKSEEKFSQIQSDITTFLSSIPFVQKMVEPRSETKEIPDTTQQLLPRYFVETGSLIETGDGCEVLSDFKELFDFSKDNLDLIGTSKDLLAPMATALLSTLIPNSKPVMLFGAGAKRIADCLSASLSNRTADYLYLENEATYRDAIKAISEVGDGRVVLVDNILLKPYFWQLVESQRTKNKTVIYSASLGEELKLLPKGAFNYIRPLLTDYYLDSINPVILFGGRIDLTDQIPVVPKGEVPGWCRNLALPKSEMGI